MNIEGYSINNYLKTRIKDESFDVDLISQFDLCLQIHDNSFNLCVIDTQSQRCLLLESYHFPHFPDRSYTDQITYLFEDHHFLMAGYWKTVKISSDNRCFSLVPASLFVVEESDKYLSCHSTYNSDLHSIHRYRHDTPDTFNVFAVNADLINKIKSFYPENIVKVVHQTSSLIQAAMKDHQSMSLKCVYITIQKNSFSIVVKNQSSLEYCNSFAFTSLDEFIYYLMFVVGILHINKKTTKVILSGQIEKASSTHSRLQQYFKFISFADKPSYLKYSYVFDEIPDHQFFDLFSIYLC